MYSNLFGLQELEILPEFILEGTFIKNLDGDSWIQHTNLKHYNKANDWVGVTKYVLPKQAHLEALLLGVQL